jgi:hypothetical protein
MIYISFTEQVSSTEKMCLVHTKVGHPILADVDHCFVSPSTTNTRAVGLHRNKAQQSLHQYVLSSPLCGTAILYNLRSVL